MVSLYPNPPPGQDFGYFCANMAGDPMKMGLPGMSNHPVQPEAAAASGSGAMWRPNSCSASGLEDPSKKVRKPYTITKSRESWTEQEHDKFLEALQLFDRDWKKIEAFVGSKTVIQIRSHAQKYFLKVQKNGTSEHVPPPRPKRKAAHPYPQKAPKHVASQAARPIQSSAALPEPRYVRPDSVAVPRNAISNAEFPSWDYNPVPTVSMPQVTKDDKRMVGVANTQNYSSSSNESTRRVWPGEFYNQRKEKKDSSMKVMPDFSQVYSFIGSAFDPDASDHLQRLKRMEPINVQTVLMLMKNLSMNLMSPEFEGHRRLLASYGGVEENGTQGGISKNLQANITAKSVLTA